MDEMLKKLMSAGVSADMLEKLKTGFGDKLEGELLSGGLKTAVEKLGLDTRNLPDVDFKNLSEAASELMGKDVDGDGKTGIMEAVDNLKEAAANTDMSAVKEFAQENAGGLLSKLKSLIGMK
jgi:hypothetical protein